MRILLVEDDFILGEGIQLGLQREQHSVEWLQDGLLAEEAIIHETFDAVVLDIGLPRRNGFDILKRVREADIDTPILLLTALSDIDDRVKGLDAGADDYLTKPFNFSEITARLRALVRRASGQIKPILEYGEIQLDPQAHSVVFRNELVSLPRREFALLEILLKNADKVISRSRLAETLYGWEQDIDSNALEVHIHNLRKKFGNAYIKTIRGVGYMVKHDSTEQ